MSFPTRHNADTRHDYREPAKDHTMVKVEITAACWARLRDGEPVVNVKPGQVLKLARWLADDLARNGKASLL